MRLIRTLSAIRAFRARATASRETIGFVPTMGALHEGHLSLIRKARSENDRVVVSVFVNPLQFGPNEDFARYPRDLRNDCALSAPAGADAVFAPGVREMYPEGFQTRLSQDRLPNHLCGLSRPGHFSGVLTVVLKLFNIVRPETAYFGQKDYQQATILRKMVDDLAVPLKIRVLPIVREADGLAMSSRNRYLSPAERQDALCLSRALQAARRLHAGGERRGARLTGAMRAEIRRVRGAKVDYVSVADPETLDELRTAGKRALAAAAVRIGRTRLIDNTILGARPGEDSLARRNTAVFPRVSTRRATPRGSSRAP